MMVGATGVAGKPGATGDTGHVHAAQHAPTTPPSANQCDGPIGKDVCPVSDRTTAPILAWSQ